MENLSVCLSLFLSLSPLFGLSLCHSDSQIDNIFFFNMKRNTCSDFYFFRKIIPAFSPISTWRIFYSYTPTVELQNSSKLQFTYIFFCFCIFFFTFHKDNYNLTNTEQRVTGMSEECQCSWVFAKKKKKLNCKISICDYCHCSTMSSCLHTVKYKDLRIQN